MRTWLAAVGTLVVAAIAGCGGSSKTTSAPPGPTAAAPSTVAKVDYGQKYLSIVNPANAAASKAEAALQALPASATSDQVRPIVAPVVTEFQKADSELAAVQWPGQAATDIRTLIGDNGALSGDLTSLESANGLTVSNIVSQLNTDAGRQRSAAAIVRADLGLPPPQS